jgi:DNA-binding beta-propeller fold protein YncE
MSAARIRGATKAFGLSVLCAIAMTSVAAAPARADFDDPIFTFTPVPVPFMPAIPPPYGYLEGPCGLTVDKVGNFYLSNYHTNAIDVFGPNPIGYPHEYRAHIPDLDPLDGPCGLALDSAGTLYVNDYHRGVIKLSTPTYPLPLAGTPPFPSYYTPVATIDSADPTGVAVDPATDVVYVDNRTYIAAYEPSGAAVEVSGQPLRIGEGSLEDGYGLAFEDGRLYVPDAASGTVKVYEPATDADQPVLEIDAAGVPGGGFNSLRDSAVAVDRVSGDIYVADNLQPGFVEEPEAAVYVFDATGAYLGRLKRNIIDALPPGLAVDNTTEPTQGRVYVTSGNTEFASVIAYPPGAATSKVEKAKKQLGEAPAGTPTPSAGASVNATAARAVSDGGAPRRRGSGASASEVAQKGNLRLALGGSLAPSKLPREGSSPVAVAIDWKLSTTDQSAVPPLKQVRVEINRHGRFDYSGLPTCEIDRIQPASSERALAACRTALVGQGSFEADISLAGQERYATKGRLLVFNGRSKGKPVLLGQIYSPHPFATSFVIVFEVQQLGGGAYGTALSATLPKALASWGNLTGVRMKLSRRYSSGGKHHSYLSAGCPAPKGFPGASFPLTRTSFEFAGGLGLSQTLTRSCKVR